LKKEQARPPGPTHPHAQKGSVYTPTTPVLTAFSFRRNFTQMVPKKTIQIGEFLAIIEFLSPDLEQKKNPFKHF